MTVTVACLIKAGDEQDGSCGAVEQEVSGVTAPKTEALKNGKMISLLLTSFPTESFNFTQQPELKVLDAPINQRR